MTLTESEPKESFIDPIQDRMLIGEQLNFARIPLWAINVLPQTRPKNTYSQEGMDNLISSMLSEDSNSIHLISPPMVARFFSEDKAYEYSRELGLLLNKPPKKTLLQAEDGCWYILVAGENRLKSINSIIENNDELLRMNHEHNIDIVCSFLDEPSVLKAIAEQLDENKHEQLPFGAEAIAINDIYRYLTTHKGMHEKDARKTLSREMGMDPSKVSRALRYMNMPEEIRLLAEQPATSRVYGSILTQTEVLAMCRKELIDSYKLLATKQEYETEIFVPEKLKSLAYYYINWKLQAIRNGRKANINDFVLSEINSVNLELNHTGSLIQEEAKITIEEQSEASKKIAIDGIAKHIAYLRQVSESIQGRP